MTEHVKEVEMGDDTFEVVYDDESNLVYKRKTLQELKDETIGSVTEDDTRAGKVVGMTTDASEDALRTWADRQDDGVGAVYITPEYLRVLAEWLCEEHAYDPVKLVVSDNKPIFADVEASDETFLLCNRLPPEDTDK